jgi:hypothetical protein
MAALVLSPSTMPREAVAAAKALLQADKLTYEIEKNLPLHRTDPVHDDTDYIDYVANLPPDEFYACLRSGHWPDPHVERPMLDAEQGS